MINHLNLVYFYYSGKRGEFYQAAEVIYQPAGIE